MKESCIEMRRTAESVVKMLPASCVLVPKLGDVNAPTGVLRSTTLKMFCAWTPRLML